MSDISGTVRKVTLNGVTYRIPNDVNMTINLSPYETEGIPSTGKTMFKKVLRMPTIENCILITNPVEAERLKERISSEFNCAELWISEFSPLMGYACGTGALGIAFYTDD